MSAEGKPVNSKKPSTASPASSSSHSPGTRTSALIQSLAFDFSWVKPACTPKNLKMLVRCLVVFLACEVLFLVKTSLSAMGQAGFFAALVSIMLTPSMPVGLFLLVASTLAMGMLVGWAWGVAAMAAALRARSQQLLATTTQAIRQEIGNGSGLTSVGYAYRGRFLDTRSTAVYGAFFFVGCLFFGLVRARAPKLMLFSIFGTIVLDVMCSYGPLFPSQQYTLARLFLIPTASYLAIAIVAIILIFPETMSHAWMDLVINGYFNLSLDHLKAQDVFLSSPLNRESWMARSNGTRKLRANMVAAVQGALAQVGMLDLEMSFGRFGPGDMKKISSKLKTLTARTLAVGSFSLIVAESFKTDIAEEATFQQANPTSTSTLGGQADQRTEDRYTALRREIREREARHGHDLQGLLPILADSSSRLRQACTDSVTHLTAFLTEVNSARYRWGAWPNEDAELAESQQRIETLVEALEVYRSKERERLVKEPFEKFFAEGQGQEKDKWTIKPELRKEVLDTEVFAARSLYVCFVFTTTIEAYAESLIEFLTHCHDLRQKRPTSRLWFPTGFGKIWRKMTSRGTSGVGGISPLGGVSDNIERRAAERNLSENADEDDDEDDDEEGDSTKKDTSDDNPLGALVNDTRDPDASPPRSASQRFAFKLSKALRFWQSPEGVFTLRYAIVSLCLWIPSVHPATSYFCYSNRAVWALIMAQTGLGVFAGDQIATFITRFGGTLVGLVLGMAVWYIGAGLGRGNPYGVAAASVVFMTPFFFARIVLPPQKFAFWLMAGVTIVFVVGYSWIDANLPLTGVNSGWGVEVAWKRALLVIIGFTAAFIIMCLPRPTSARVMVRKTAVRITEDTLAVFASEIETFLFEEARFRSSEATKDIKDKAVDDKLAEKRKAARMAKISAQWLKIAETLQTTPDIIEMAVFEPALRGKWPKKTYDRLFDAQWRLVMALSILSGSLAKLPSEWCSLLVHKTPFLNPNALADVFSTVSLAAHSLSGSHPLPASLPSLRERLIYHERHSHATTAPATYSSSSHSSSAPEEEDNNQPLDPSPEKFDGVSLGLKNLTFSTLSSEQLPVYATAGIALAAVYVCFEEIIRETRSLVGSSSRSRGFSEWGGQHLRREEEGYRSRVNQARGPPSAKGGQRPKED